MSCYKTEARQMLTFNKKKNDNHENIGLQCRNWKPFKFEDVMLRKRSWAGSKANLYWWLQYLLKKIIIIKLNNINKFNKLIIKQRFTTGYNTDLVSGFLLIL